MERRVFPPRAIHHGRRQQRRGGFARKIHRRDGRGSIRSRGAGVRWGDGAQGEAWIRRDRVRTDGLFRHDNLRFSGLGFARGGTQLAVDGRRADVSRACDGGGRVGVAGVPALARHPGPASRGPRRHPLLARRARGGTGRGGREHRGGGG